MIYLHKQKIIHKDLKPENLMIHFPSKPKSQSLKSFIQNWQIGDELQLKITDFGVSRIDKAALTSAAGTPQYMSPEQNRCLSSTTPYPFDIFSFGVILYELQFGFRPFLEKDNNAYDRHGK